MIHIQSKKLKDPKYNQLLCFTSIKHSNKNTTYQDNVYSNKNTNIFSISYQITSPVDLSNGLVCFILKERSGCQPKSYNALYKHKNIAIT